MPAAKNMAKLVAFVHCLEATAHYPFFAIAKVKKDRFRDVRYDFLKGGVGNGVTGEIGNIGGEVVAIRLENDGITQWDYLLSWACL